MRPSRDALWRASHHEGLNDGKQRTAGKSRAGAWPRLHSAHDPSVARRGGLRLRGSSHDRAGAHAHLLGRHVLPLRVPGDLDRAVRPQRERRLRVSRARAARPARRPTGCSRVQSLVYAVCTIVALFVLVRLRVGLNYSPAQSRADADDLRARGAAVLHGRARHHAGDLAALLAHQRRLRRRSARRRRRLPGPDSAARSPRRARRRADGGRARR